MIYTQTGKLLILFIAITFMVGCSHLRAQQRPPNIILIIGDDQGWTDYGFMPSSRELGTNRGPAALNEVVQTPSLDKLARSGVVFSNTHVTASLCRQSLRTLLSAAGMHAFQWSDQRAELEALSQIEYPQDSALRFPRAEVQYIRTLPRELQQAGYQSWQGGKYWESTYDKGGFTAGLAVTDGEPLKPEGWDMGRAGWDPTVCGPESDPTIPCPALDSLRLFLDDVDDVPFFLWFAPALPHTPFDAPQNLREPYEALGLQSCEDVGCSEYCAFCASEVNYLANVTWLDSLVGELVQELETRNLRDNTLLIYLTDNGFGLNYQLFAGTGKGKNTLYEMGFRTPMIFNWPGQIPQGVVHDDLVSSTDVAPTILDYAGVDQLPEQEGISIRQRVEGGAPTGRTEIIGFQQHIGHFLRNDTWRYLRFAKDGREELYRIDIDPFEDNDVAAAHPALLEQFSARVDAWEAKKRSRVIPAEPAPPHAGGGTARRTQAAASGN